MKVTYPPISLYGSVNAPSSGGTQLLETSIKNPFRENMWLDELKFNLQGLGSGGTDAPVGPGQYYARVSMGRVPLTGGAYVPVWLFGKTLTNAQDVVRGLSTSGDPTFHWRFTKPLFVPSSEALTVVLYCLTNNITRTTVNVTATGRCIAAKEPLPPELNVPFAAAFVGTQNVGGANYVDQSYERDLMNPFNVDLFVERFNGRVGVTANTTQDYDSNGVGNKAVAVFDQAGATNCLVRASSSTGGMMVRDAAPFDHLFYGPERSWQVNTWIPPKAFFKFYLQENYSSLSGTKKYRPQIAMVGYRKVQLNEVYK